MKEIVKYALLSYSEEKGIPLGSGPLGSGPMVLGLVIPVCRITLHDWIMSTIG